MKGRRAIPAIILSAALAACESGLDQRYLDASVGDKLELPPDLTGFEVESQFELPSAFSGDDLTERNRIPVLARVESVHLEGSGDMYWLTVEEPVSNLYQIVRNFWGSEGYRLVVDEPVIGMMQTEWIYREQGAERDLNWFQRLFGSKDLTASQDQFKTRIERGEDGKNRIYIAHRGTEYIHEIELGDDRAAPEILENDEFNQWRFRRQEPELEIEMLSRLMVYLGLQRSAVEAQAAEARLFAPRAFLHLDPEENSPYLILKDAYQIAWNRVYHELERMNMDIETAEFKSGLSSEGVFVINTGIAEEKEEKGGFFSLFSSADEAEPRKIVLVLSEETHELTRVEIENQEGDRDTSAEGNRFMQLLYQKIR